MERKTILKITILLLSLFAFSFILGKVFHIGLPELEEIVSSLGIFAPIGYTLLLFLGLSVPFNPISDYLVVNLAAILLPVPVAIASTFVAHTLSLTLNYFIGRKFGWNFISKFTSEKEEKYLEDLVKKINPSQIFFLRFLLPLTAIGVDIVSYAAGISKISFGKFLLVSIIPWTILNILFFIFTKYAISKNALFFFIPGLVLILIPVLIQGYIRSKKTE